MNDFSEIGFFLVLHCFQKCHIHILCNLQQFRHKTLCKNTFCFPLYSCVFVCIFTFHLIGEEGMYYRGQKSAKIGDVTQVSISIRRIHHAITQTPDYEPLFQRPANAKLTLGKRLSINNDGEKQGVYQSAKNGCRRLSWPKKLLTAHGGLERSVKQRLDITSIFFYGLAAPICRGS